MTERGVIGGAQVKERLASNGTAAVTVETGPLQNGFSVVTKPMTAEPVQLMVEGNSGDEWSVEHSSSSEEDYDALKPDPSAVVEGGKGGGLELQDEDTSGESNGTMGLNGDARAIQAFRSPTSSPTQSRRRNIQVVLEKTDKKGRYVLTADDPDIRDILRRGIEREASPTKPRTRFRDLVFSRQFTTFDRQNPRASDSPFHGFFTLFWLAMGMLLAKVALQNWKAYGSVFGGKELLHMMFDRDVIVMGITDGVMCLTTLSGLFLQKLIFKGYLRWDTSGWVIQNIWQAFYLGAFIGWTFYRDWPWTHTIFIVLHAIVFLMKQHSYSFYNGYLSQVYRRRDLLEQKLDQLDQLDNKEPLASPFSAPTSPQRGYNSSISQPDSGELLHRRKSLGSKASTNLKKEHSEISEIAQAIESGKSLDAAQLRAFTRVISNEIASLTAELNGKCTEGAGCYPNNLNLANFADWTCLPTLVYELEYPRQEHINWWYVAEKSAATLGVIWVMMVISQAYIYPLVTETLRMKEAGMTLAERWSEFPWILSDMLFPLLLEQLLSWYVIWECVLNVLAEITRFADRGFYGDWWNSVSWDQYARDWNRPVHNFLLRHVYHSSISAFHLSKSSATLITFLLSALVHELVMFCLFKKVRGYLFTMQLMQLPLVSLSRSRLLKGRTVLGNVVFWFGLFVGPSLLTSLYLIV